MWVRLTSSDASEKAFSDNHPNLHEDVPWWHYVPFGTARDRVTGIALEICRPQVPAREGVIERQQPCPLTLQMTVVLEVTALPSGGERQCHAHSTPKNAWMEQHRSENVQTVAALFLPVSSL